MTARTLTEKCFLCKKKCRANQNGIYCDVCCNWFHFQCTNLVMSQFLTLGASDLDYYCSDCSNVIFPFQNLKNEDLENVFSGSKSLNAAAQMQQDLSSTNPLYKITSNYCEVEKLNQKYQHHKNLSIMHVNIRSLTKNISKLQELLSLGHTRLIYQLAVS